MSALPWKTPAPYGVTAEDAGAAVVWNAWPQLFIVCALACHAEIALGIVIAVPRPGGYAPLGAAAGAELVAVPAVHLRECAEPRFAALVGFGPSCVPTIRKPYFFA